MWTASTAFIVARRNRNANPNVLLLRTVRGSHSKNLTPKQSRLLSQSGIEMVWLCLQELEAEIMRLQQQLETRTRDSLRYTQESSALYTQLHQQKAALQELEVGGPAHPADSNPCRSPEQLQVSAHAPPLKCKFRMHKGGSHSGEDGRQSIAECC